MTHRRCGILSTVLLALGCSLLGCAQPRSVATDSGSFTVQSRLLVHNVDFAEGAIGETTDRDLRRFLDGLGPADDMSVRFEASGTEAKTRIDQVAKAFVGMNVAVADYSLDTGPADAVRIVVRQSRIEPRSCLYDGSGMGKALTGCLNDRALHNMVVDRRDLIYGRDLGPAPAALAAAHARAAEMPPKESPNWLDLLEEQEPRLPLSRLFEDGGISSDDLRTNEPP